MYKFATVHLGQTIEELILDNHHCATVDCTITCRVYPGDKGDWTTPPCGPEVEWIDYDIDNVVVYDNDGNEVNADVGKIIGAFVEDWIEKNDDYIHEKACEQAEDDRQGALDAYYDMKMEEMREKRYER